jgi:hypothetical protein
LLMFVGMHPRPRRSGQFEPLRGGCSRAKRRAEFHLASPFLPLEARGLLGTDAVKGNMLTGR